MNAQQLLDILRDARELQDGEFERAVLEQLDVDVSYVRMAPGKLAPIRPWPWRWTSGTEEEETIEEETIEEFRARIGREYRAWQSRDWTKWRNRRAKVELTSLSEIYKRHYSDVTTAEMTIRQHPMLAMMGGRLTVVVDEQDAPSNHAYVTNYDKIDWGDG